ncbi:MAG: 50S ribosomal protein L11 [Ktedonobacteraceae bacterium]|nr:50S ribosomal protein L11 [Ktedonobacteraceae bacterium]
MAKQITAIRQLILNAGKATPAYPVGPVLGAYGINLGLFVKEFNARTTALTGYQVPVEVTIYIDRSFSMHIKEPTVASLLQQIAGIEKGAGEPGHATAGQITRAQLRQIAERKMAEMNTVDLAGAEKAVAGTARSMGIMITDNA